MRLWGYRIPMWGADNVASQDPGGNTEATYSTNPIVDALSLVVKSYSWDSCFP